MKQPQEEIENAVKGEIYSVERLEEYAAFLAGELKISEDPKLSQPLLPRMRENGKKLLSTYRALTQAIHRKETIPPAAEWLTDNFHIIEDQLREIQEDLPPSFYKELPKIAFGGLQGYPRIYGIALALIAHTDSQLEAETIRRFAKSYQKVSPLNIGELWALAITLRLVLVENLRRLAVRILADHEKRNLANQVADRIFESVNDPVQFKINVEKIATAAAQTNRDDCAYLAQLSKRLRDQEPEIWPALQFLEKHLADNQLSAEKVVHLSHQQQAASQVTVANIITSMRLISSLNWRDFFESLSLVDRVLEKDPVYSEMDFVTRDRYRHVLEKISKKTGHLEIEIAEAACKLSSENKSPNHIPKQAHVGYYLIDRGYLTLKKQFGLDSTTFLEFAHSKPNFTYFGLIAILLVLVCAFPLYYASQFDLSWGALIGLFLLILIPCSDLALSLTNMLITRAIKPRNLPKLDLSKGIPPKGRSIVIIPCMLASLRVIEELLQKLEIHYLGNSDEELYFGLLTDFTDAPSETLPIDEVVLQAALKGIARLNKKYATENEKFFLFHRRRQHNPAEDAWMGWERKRGKLQEFNQLLRSATKTSFSVVTAPAELLPSIRYVITLDADTQLPRDTARKLIGTILHPLNQPVFDAVSQRVIDGYALLQPRIGISLESSNRSYFSKIFSGYIGIDPYTTAVSEVYQDLFHEGSYTGKGLYDVDAFEAALKGRVPENTILSHDLFEGLFSRAALLSDIELLDDYPQTYRTFFTRQHRWTRGDWQIASWILPYVRNEKNQRVRNHLPLVSRWKIFDNLRRSLVAPATFLWIALAWLMLPGSPLVWFGTAVTLVVLPHVIQTLIDAANLHFGKRALPLSDLGAQIKINFFQVFFQFAFLAHQAVIHIDSIWRVSYRQIISKRKLLEWATAAQIENQSNKDQKPFWQKPWLTELTLALFAVAVILKKPDHLGLALALILIWMGYPLLSEAVSKKLTRKIKPLAASDQMYLRQIARRTWHYFEKFVTAEDNFLPPDNHQMVPHPVTAHRTSPTNMGLYLMALTSAKDFGYISNSKLMEKLKQTLTTLDKMELYQGHFLNWYDTQTLAPLHPKYVSTVDSGNLAGYLIATRQHCLSLPNTATIDPKALEGLADILTILETETRQNLDSYRRLLTAPAKNDFTSWFELLESIRISWEDLPVSPWVQLGLQQIADLQHEVQTFAPWSKNEFPKKFQSVVNQLQENVSMKRLLKAYDKALVDAKEIDFKANFIQSLEQAKLNLETLLNEAKAAEKYLDQKFNEMNFGFLLEPDREVFVIGYSVSDSKFDRGLYDLLGSESRLASFVAIAKGDISQEHWFRLGRQLVPAAGGRALVSWTASMFEYLMPILVLKNYENTLLHETMNTVVDRQIKYGAENNVPWGISEAGYNARDLQMNYQYGPFGVPGLGLKRGLSHDLVISPYSTVLAAQVNPHAALENLKALQKNNLLADCGFYEAVDYTRERLPENENFAVIKSFMAHHQGMSLVALNNVVHKNIMQNRFHDDPRVRATRLLLQERIPQFINVLPPKAAEIELETQKEPQPQSLVRHFTDADSPTPRMQLLSNRNYSLMITTAGSGYSKCDNLAVTRWKEDATRDHLGSFIFIKDRTSKKLWSTTYQPFGEQPENYKVSFGEEKVEFRRRDGDISSYTQILVAPEDNVEIRHVTITNHSDEAHEIELTSYLEPVLGPATNDLDHMAFSKLFLQTEFLPSKNALLARRRKRSEHDIENFGLHVVFTDAEMISDVQYETDRTQFIGRGRNLKQSICLEDGQNLTNSSGATIDPIMSLRVHVMVPANSKIEVAFTTGLALSREKALQLADRYHDIHAFERESKLAWTQSQVDLRHLNVDPQSAVLYQRLAERILFSEPSLRPPTYLRAANTSMQSSLWSSGIGGDLPIVVVSIKDPKDIAAVRKLIRCHEYLRLKGLIYDFVIINEHVASYHQELQDELQLQIRTTGSQEWLNKNGGIFILRADITPERNIANIQAVARVSLSADQPLAEQINRRALEEKDPPLAVYTKQASKDKSAAPTKLDLLFFNGLGGFTPDGKEYVTLLEDRKSTPAPWINVIGNKLGFGFQISESGSGFTWSINSQSNRLTAWSNDPVQDPPGEIIYLRDDETGEVWTPTPLPIRSLKPYVVRHGQGYSIIEHEDHGFKHEIKLFVPHDEPIKISLLKLKNTTSRTRKISIISYTEWVLGKIREKNAPFLNCDIDKESGAVFAKNPHDNEFAGQVSFADISQVERSFTCSRKEFLGRHGNYENPAALSRTGLSKRRSTGQDPCAVLQTSVEIKPNEEFEMAVLLGQCDSVEKARQLTLKYRDLNLAKKALSDVIAVWREVLDVIQVKTPDSAMDIMMNNWLMYQTLSCRYWSRTAFYQSGGAYGFRDQLQDCMAFTYAAPEITKEQILRASRHQFKEGDVQHWWHPPSGRGIRTRMTDDLLWLPFVVSFYIQTTGDKTILDQKTTFLQAELLKPEQEDSYTLPGVTTETETILEHCLRAIDYSLTVGEHGLPLIGTGDWNDGMNRVGPLGKGESVWLAWFLYKVLADFLPHCDSAHQQKYEDHMNKLKVAIEKNAWDGDWYKRAYYDDGTAIGSHLSEDCRIDSISQTWSILSKAGDPIRSRRAMEKVYELLVCKNSKLILLLSPPFDQGPKDPGYIKGYVPGVRENGGQYTHAAIWVMMAYAEMGDGEKAKEMFQILNPISHGDSAEAANLYKVEPYVLAGDVYGGNAHEGRGGWSWYTGSSSWLYRGGLETILGFQLRGDNLMIDPCIPKEWKSYQIKYRFKQTAYIIEVKNPLGLNKGTLKIEVDGNLIEEREINLKDDRKEHMVTVTLQ